MIHPKKLVKMARKSFARGDGAADSSGCTASKGHFVVYTIDERRFVFPLAYLDTPIFKELFKMSEDVFGLLGNDRIVLPCDAIFMEYVVSLIQRSVSKNVEKALVISLSTHNRCSASSLLPQLQPNQQTLLNSF